MTSALAGSESAVRDRFRLAARWYAQGWLADNLIDRFLGWFISLEVHPTAGAVDVPKEVRDYLHEKVYPNMRPPDLMARCYEHATRSDRCAAPDCPTRGNRAR